MGGLKLWGVLVAVFLVGTGAFHTPYKPEKSRHFDASKSSSFSAITDKVCSGPARAPFAKLFAVGGLWGQGLMRVGFLTGV
jgi:hypothetical protein